MKLEEYLIRLMLEGKHQQAAKAAHQATGRYKEDPSSGSLTEEHFDGTCGFCGHVFGAGDCQHQVINRVACDRCYLDRQ